MPNSQEKAQLLPPRREDADRPPIALKISHNLVHESCRLRTSAVTFSVYRASTCEIIGKKRQNTKWAHWPSTTYDGEFWPFSIFSQLLSDGGLQRYRSAPVLGRSEHRLFRCVRFNRGSLAFRHCCARGRAHSAEAIPRRG